MPTSSQSRGSWPHTGAVLAGGLSSRMGSPKMRLRLPDGRMLIDVVIAQLEQVCARVVVCGEPAGLDKANWSCTTLRDNFGGGGPLAGVEALLASGLDRYYLIAAGDQPYLTQELLQLLVVDDPERVHFFFDSRSGKIHPLPVYVPARFHSVVIELLQQGNASFYQLARVCNPRQIELNADQAVLLRSINTPEEFALMIQEGSA